MNHLTDLLRPVTHATRAALIVIFGMAALGCQDQATADDVRDTETTDATVTIATFNIQIFGKSKRSKPEVMEVLVDIADEFDILAVQEMREPLPAVRVTLSGRELGWCRGLAWKRGAEIGRPSLAWVRAHLRNG